jgi:NACHT domain
VDLRALLAATGAVAAPLSFIAAAVHRRFRRSGSEQIEPFSRYVTQGTKYYFGRFLRRQLASEFTLRQYARLHLRSTAADMLVPATYPVRLAVDEVFVPLLLRSTTHNTIEYNRLIERPGARTLVLGDPGSGKSSLMKRSFRDACRRAAAEPRVSPLPILFELREFADLLSDRNATVEPTEFLTLTAKPLTNAAVFKTSTPLKHLQHGPGLLLLLDGLDEVPTELTHSVCSAIVELAIYLGSSSPASSLVISTRTQHYLTLQDRRLDETFEVLTLRPFTISDIYQFLLRWPFKSHARQNITRLFSRIRQLPSLTEMCTNPLALAMFVARDQQTGGEQSPDTRTEFYRALVDELLANRRLRREEGAVGGQRLRHAREQVLGQACLAHLLAPEESPNSIPVGRMITAIRSAGYGGSDSEAALGELAVDTGLFAPERRGETIRFLHLTLCEHLAARELVNLGSPGWGQVAPLVAVSPLERRAEQADAGAIDWRSRLAELIAFASGLAPRALRLDILSHLVKAEGSTLLLRAAIEAQMYQDPAVAGAVRHECGRLELTQPKDWDIEWFTELRWLLLLLRDATATFRAELGSHGNLSFPEAGDYVMELISRHRAQDLLLPTLARQDAESAISIAEGSSRPELMDLVAGAADDFSVLTGILARCEAGALVWERALLRAALLHSNIARVLVSAAVELPPPDQRRFHARGWSTSFLTRGTVYGTLLEDVLNHEEVWPPTDRALFESVKRLNPPQSLFLTSLRASTAELVTAIALQLITVSFVLANRGGFFSSAIGTAIFVAATAIAVLLASRIILPSLETFMSGTFSRASPKRASRIVVSIGSVSIEWGGVRRSRRRIALRETDLAAKPIRRATRTRVFREILNLARFEFADLRDTENELKLGQLGWLRAGVRDEELRALTIVRRIREK